MKYVFVVQHEHELPGYRDMGKSIGVYETREDADRAVERLKQEAGFRDHPDGFSVDEYEVGKDHWTGGFVTVHAAGKPDYDLPAWKSL